MQKVFLVIGGVFFATAIAIGGIIAWMIVYGDKSSSNLVFSWGCVAAVIICLILAAVFAFIDLKVNRYTLSGLAG